MTPGALDTEHDRRRWYRAGVHGCAVIHAQGGTASHGVIADLGLGGMRVVEVGEEETLEPGSEVVVEIECAGAGWVAQRGRVLRKHRHELAIIFHALAPEVEDLIEDEMLGAVEAERAPCVVVVDRAPERRERVAGKLRALGCHCLPVATPLEAVEEIERSRNHVRAVALSVDLTQTNPEDFVRYLAETHPSVRIATLEGDGDRAVRELGDALCR